MPETDPQNTTAQGDLVRIGGQQVWPACHVTVGSANGTAIVTEEYARLHADIERAASPAHCFVVGVTSAVYGEGKTTVAMNLAGTIAQNSQARVTLVDCNLRNWGVQERLNIADTAGLVDILEGAEDDLTNVLHRTDLDNLAILPSGRQAGNPSRLVRSPRLGELMSALRMSNDFVVVDLPPVLPVADTRTLTRFVDGVVLVVRAGITPRDVAARAMGAVGTDKVLGVVLNGVESAMPQWLQRYFS
ncbi:MAG TPA: CpsD/CapB family tyrosine-protein kinase [Chthonomonadales bacterium]|nr:CpsD/CapB family tyrosine-protein kinase [Chthonomonadales bacterium]